MLKWFVIGMLWLLPAAGLNAAAPAGDAPLFPPPLTSYEAPEGSNAWEQIKLRAKAEPLNVIVTALFLCAIVHTFMAPRIMHYAHVLRDRHAETARAMAQSDPHFPKVSFRAEMMHFLGEIEAVFGIWLIPLAITLTVMRGWETTVSYVHNLHFEEPVFVVIIMTIASTRPVLTMAEWGLSGIVRLFGSSPGAWWFCLLSFSPLLGSFITEPAAMTISALLLRDKFFKLGPPVPLAYATVGLLFVNVSIGGALTNFAAPPILMVAAKWEWSTLFVLSQFGLKSTISTFLNTIVYFIIFRKQFAALSGVHDETADDSLNQRMRERGVPLWIILVHLCFLGWTVFAAHHSPFIVFGFLIFLAFAEATQPHQNTLALRPALLVGFFLAGLVVHGGLQGWWIQPLLSTLPETPLMFGAMALTAFNDNAAITYLASQVPNLSDSLKYAVVAGALIGGGLTVIANAPNPAGQSLLQRYFPEGLSPLKLFLGALTPTLLTALIFWLLPH